MTIHLNELMIIGLCCIPGAFVLAFLALWIFQSWEIGALAASAWVFFPVLAAGIAMILIGTGMEIH
jgi:hypothetical protein